MEQSDKSTLNYRDHFECLKDQLSLTSRCPSPDKIEGWASVQLVFAHDGSDLAHGLKLAMIRRTEKEGDPWSGHYAFPGGRVEPNENFYEAGVRETHEEIGIRLSQSHYLGEFLHMQLRYRGEDLPFAISAHASYLEAPQAFSPCPDEVDESFWFYLKDLHHYDHLQESEFHLGGALHKLPCLKFEGHTVWGISYLILREFFKQVDGLPFGHKQHFQGDFLPPYSYGKKA